MQTRQRKIDMKALFKSAATAISALILLGGWGPAIGQDVFPSRPLRFVVPYPPGASTDSMARAAARELAKELKVGVVVENKPGGGTTIGALAVRNAPADGYTLLFQVDGLYTGKMAAPSIAYEYSDFEILAPLAQTPFVLIVPGSANVQVLEDLKKRAAAKQGELDFGTLGLGVNHYGILSRTLGKHLGLGVRMIPYKGGVEGTVAVMAGEIDGYFATVSLASTLKNNPQARLLAMTSDKGQNKFLPGVKSFAELGVADMVFRSLYGVAVRSGTPPAIKARLEQALQKVIETDELKAAREAISLEDYTGSVDAYRKEVQANLKYYQAAKALEDAAAK